MAEETRRLFMELRSGEALTIDGTTVTLIEKSGQRARLQIEHVGAKVAYAGPERRKATRPEQAKTA